jgi:4-hydroxy-tetrahydrodipicolinate reductase
VRRVGVVGAAGRMGTCAATAIAAAPDLELTALVGPHPGADVDGADWVLDVAGLDPGRVDVLVDLTRPDVARRTVAWALEHGVDLVVGTSGLRDEDLAPARAAGTGRVLIVPNFSIGAVLLVRFAAAAAAHFESVEVIELHHDRKRDAPSGTSLATAAALAAARRDAGLDDVVDPTEVTLLEGARGATGPGGVRVHSVRLPGLLAHQEVLFGGPGEGLTLRHDTYDRDAFMGGLLLAVRRVDRIEGVAVGLEHVLDG